MSRGQRLVLQDGERRSIIAGPIRHKGMVGTFPLADPLRDMTCPGCHERMYPWNRMQFVRHAAGLSCRNPKALDEYLDRAFGETSRHAAIKEWWAHDYARTPAWDARTEFIAPHCRPDVALFRTKRRARRRGVELCDTAGEVQLVDITQDEIDRRTRTHRIDGFDASIWLRASDTVAPWSGLGHVVGLTHVDQVIGVASNVHPHWSFREWLDPMDLDEFTAAHRAQRIILHPDYGVVTNEAWQRYQDEGSSPRAPKHREPERDIPEHVSPHDNAPTPQAGPCWCPLHIARMLRTVTEAEVRRAIYATKQGAPLTARDKQVSRLIERVHPAAEWATPCQDLTTHSLIAH